MLSEMDKKIIITRKEINLNIVDYLQMQQLEKYSGQLLTEK
jgi:hypothetical protein